MVHPRGRQRLWLLLVQRFASEGAHANLAWAAVLGLAGALATIAFREGIAGLQWLLVQRSGGLVETARGLPWWERLLLPFCEGGQAKVLMASLKPVSTEGRFESRGLMTNNEARRYLVYAIIDQGLVAGRTSRRGPNEEIV